MTRHDDDWDPRALVELTWVRTRHGRRLHHALVADDFDAEGAGVTSCGVASTLWIPGIFSRMSVPRCQRCCAVVGMPDGVGSPKNDPACRVLLGLAGEQGPGGATGADGSGDAGAGVSATR